MTAGAQVARWDGHTDYVRAAACSPANAETWATGAGGRGERGGAGGVKGCVSRVGCVCVGGDGGGLS